MKLQVAKSVVVILGLFSIPLYGQESYSVLIHKAYNVMWKEKDMDGHKKALRMYEDAFELFPDSIDTSELNDASILAAWLNDHDKAFKYLNAFVTMKTAKNGYPSWKYVVGNDSEVDYKNLLDDPRWITVKNIALKDKALFYDKLRGEEEEFYEMCKIDLERITDPMVLYDNIRNYHPYKLKQKQDYSLTFQINDSARTSFFIHLPQNYNPEKKYPLLFFLHGAVRGNRLADFQLASWVLFDWNRYYTKYAALNDVILVFPRGSKEFNWMVPDDGFFMVPAILHQIKKAINVDDNKVFISGHSNGATGSFSYLMKHPSSFAGCYGFNTYPKVFTGGTFIENIKNRSFINFSTDKDYYYPPYANDQFTQLMKSMNLDYKEYRYDGFPHWFPQFDDLEPAYRILFSDLVKRERNPFPKEISWEFDDDCYGTIDWLSNIKLDTLVERKSWHKELNFKIDKWLKYDKNDSIIVYNVDRKAFDFPRKSGKIKAEYGNNVFRIETSCITSFSVNISPEMVDMKKKVQIYVNGKLRFSKQVGYDRDFMLCSFKANRDRSQVWVNQIDVFINRH